jgi:hypothetical protein
MILPRIRVLHFSRKQPCELVTIQNGFYFKQVRGGVDEVTVLFQEPSAEEFDKKKEKRAGGHADDETTAYKPKHGRDNFHVVPLLFVATNSRKPKSPDAHAKSSFVIFSIYHHGPLGRTAPARTIGKYVFD